MLYYRKSDNIIYVGLADFLFKTNEHLRLAELLWAEGLTASVHELALMSGLPYATAHELLQKLEKMDLVQKTKKGRATLFSSKVSPDDLKHLQAVMGQRSLPNQRPLADFIEMDLPLVGEFQELYQETAQSTEELLVKAVVLAKKSASLLRTLPLLVKRLGPTLNRHQLAYWSRRHQVDRELGFVLDLTADLSKEKRFGTLAKNFKDKRWSRLRPFFDSDSDLSGFQAKLVERNTPELAKKWFLKMNMGLDSFRSHYLKFA